LKEDHPSLAKTAASDPKSNINVTVAKSGNKISDFSTGQKTTIKIASKECAIKDEEHFKSHGKKRLEEWAKHSIPKGEIKFIPKESTVIELGYHSFKDKFSKKLPAKLYTITEDKQLEEMKNFFRQNKTKVEEYEIKNFKVEIMGKKEYKFCLKND
jgi:hypothetical protein